MSARTTFASRVHAVAEALREPIPKSPKQWFDELSATPDPEQGLAVWEIVAFAYSAFFEARTPTAKAKDQAIRVLLDCSAGYSETRIHQQAYKSLSIAEIRSLMEHYCAAALATHEITHLRSL